MGDLKAVEALRGLAAIGLATYGWLWALGMAGAAPAENLPLLYDLLFVISGFVIAQVYRARLVSAREAARFALLRFGRVYPLHVAALMALLALQTAGVGAGPGGASGSLGDLIANLAMLQGVGLIEPGAWNPPAWFISAEFTISILFALLCLADIPRSGAGLGALALCALWAVWTLAERPAGPPFAGSDALLRGFAGFMLGVLAQAARRARPVARAMDEMGMVQATAWQGAAMIASAALILYAPPAIHALAPMVFTALVFAVSGGRGAVRRLLEAGPFQALAQVWFGVLMFHWLLVGPMRTAVNSAAAWGSPVTPVEAAALGAPLYLLATLVLAAAAERWVERPTRAAMRAWIERRNRAYSAAARHRPDAA